MAKDLEKKNVKIHYMNLHNKLDLPKLVSKLKIVIKKENPDIIYSYLPWSGLIARSFGRLLGSASLEGAMASANEMAVRNVDHRGARGLHLFLSGRITPVQE